MLKSFFLPTNELKIVYIQFFLHHADECFGGSGRGRKISWWRRAL